MNVLIELLKWLVILYGVDPENVKLKEFVVAPFEYENERCTVIRDVEPLTDFICTLVLAPISEASLETLAEVEKVV